MRMGNPLVENKPGSFHWAPIFPERNTVLTLGNFSTLKNYEKTANLELNFYRIEDSSNSLKRYPYHLILNKDFQLMILI